MFCTNCLTIETCSNVQRHLLNYVLFDWRLFVAVLREHNEQLNDLYCSHNIVRVIK